MSGFLRELVGLCLIRTVMDLILPEGDTARFADLGVSLGAMLCMLRAFLSLLRGAV